MTGDPGFGYKMERPVSDTCAHICRRCNKRFESLARGVFIAGEVETVLCSDCFYEMATALVKWNGLRIKTHPQGE